MAEKNAKRRSEKAGLLNFSREMISALLMAFVAIVYVIQAFKIPTGSMEKSLLVGDFLLGLKFIYGAPVLPFTYAKFPGITDPKPGDVVIFKYPGNDSKDYIKRCVAGPGQTIEVHGQRVLVDGEQLVPPPASQYERDGQLAPQITNFAPLYIPQRGDTIVADTLPTREFLFLKNLVHQEYPRDKVTARYELYVGDTLSNNRPFPCRLLPGGGLASFKSLDVNSFDNWFYLEVAFEDAAAAFGPGNIRITKAVYHDGEQIHTYVVRNNNYFMMGDNRDNSADSRYWGFLNDKFVKAKAFIIYFSLRKDVPFIFLPFKIRWNRIGKLIRSWDGLEGTRTATAF